MAVQFLDTVIQQLTRYVITVVNQICSQCLFIYVYVTLPR